MTAVRAGRESPTWIDGKASLVKIQISGSSFFVEAIKWRWAHGDSELDHREESQQRAPPLSLVKTTGPEAPKAEESYIEKGMDGSTYD
jgi:hypothetical protein